MVIWEAAAGNLQTGGQDRHNIILGFVYYFTNELTEDITDRQLIKFASNKKVNKDQ